MARAMPRDVAAAESLQTRLESGERFGQPDLIALLQAIAGPLGDAHRTGRFHGRIGPADIRFDEAGAVTLEGWGRDITPDPVRTSCYAAIECYAPVHPQGPWTDVYALGAVLWRAITGDPPAEVLHRKGDVSLAKLAPPGFDPAFLRSVDAALEVAPQRRPQSIDAWLAMFAPHPVEQQPVVPAPGKAAGRPYRFAWPALASAGLAAAVAVAWLGPQPHETPSPQPRSQAKPAPTAAEPIVDPRPAVVPSVAVEVAEPAPPAPARSAAVPAPATPKPRPVAVAAAEPPARSKPAPPAAKPTPRPAAAAPAPIVEPDTEPDTEPGTPPRALLVRADRRLRQLFDDYARLRARVERSYDDPDIPYAVKRRAYREGLDLQKELVELRDARNRIARTGNFQVANRRFDDLEAAAEDVRARMEALRRSI